MAGRALRLINFLPRVHIRGRQSWMVGANYNQTCDQADARNLHNSHSSAVAPLFTCNVAAQKRGAEMPARSGIYRAKLWPRTVLIALAFGMLGLLVPVVRAPRCSRASEPALAE